MYNCVHTCRVASYLLHDRRQSKKGYGRSTGSRVLLVEFIGEASGRHRAFPFWCQPALTYPAHPQPYLPNLTQQRRKTWRSDAPHRLEKAVYPPSAALRRVSTLARVLRIPKASKKHINSSLQCPTNAALRDMLAMGSLLETPTTDDKELQHFRAKITADQKNLRSFLHQQWQKA